MGFFFDLLEDIFDDVVDQAIDVVATIEEDGLLKTAAKGAAAVAVGVVAAPVATAVGSVVTGTATVGAAASSAAGAIAATTTNAVAGVAVKKAGQKAMKTVVKAAISTVDIGDSTGKSMKAETKGTEISYDYGVKNVTSAPTQKLRQMLEANENLLFGMFATALYVVRLDGETKEEVECIESRLGYKNFSSEKIKQEIQKIYQLNDSFYTIRMKYLDKVSFEELRYVDEIIREAMNADKMVSKEEKYFYENQWMPYFKIIESEKSVLCVK